MSLPLTIRRLPEVRAQTDARTLRGTFAGIVSSTRIHHSAIEPLIPVGSGLTPVEESEDDKYLVSFLFGQQRQVRSVWGRWEFQYGFGVKYEEVLMVIPGLKLPPTSDYSELPAVTLYARIYLNSLCSSVLGRFMYGFSKHHGRFENEENSFTAFNRHDERIFQAKVSSAEGTVSGSEIERVRELFAQPVVFAGKPQNGGESVLSIRQFDYEIHEDFIQPMETEVTVDQKFTKKSPTLTFSNVGLDRDPSGSFRCEFPWIMTQCHRAA